jgi:hypothetical protein
MFKMYHANNEDIEFKFIHVFKRIEKCDKWALVRALTPARPRVGK